MSSLIEGNIYLYLFVDSYSRKCFPYYSKNKDEKDTLRIMKQHFKENVIGVLNEDVDIMLIMKCYCNRAEEGILVGFESNFRPTYTYKIYLPHKNAKVYV